MSAFSFVVLTFNEEIHLARLLRSIISLDAPIFVLDSGSTDATLTICQKYKVKTAYHAFENHPKQWDFALKVFAIETPWVICLDADQEVLPELFLLLKNFKNEDYSQIDGIYFNRKNCFKGKWIKHGGYYPFYQLKMFRYQIGFSDLNENMDHRFIVAGKTAIWKKGYLHEENLKENNIRFWIDKHNVYSDLTAQEEVERFKNLRLQTIEPKILGTPDERRAWLKKLWWKLPLYWRPFIYFLHRFIIKRGFLDGKNGIIFHFLQAFWFRLMVDIKIDEILKTEDKQLIISPQNQNKVAFKFAFSCVLLFGIFYFFNIFYNGLMAKGGNYNAFLSAHFNYIQWLRSFLLNGSAAGLQLLGYQTKTNNVQLLAVGFGKINVAYDCLGLGVMSFLLAFAITYPAKAAVKLKFLISAIAGFQLLNIVRLMFLAIYWHGSVAGKINHHTIFNILIYSILFILIYTWIENSTIKEASV